MFKWFRVSWLLALLLLVVPGGAQATTPCVEMPLAKHLEGATAVVYGRLYNVKTTSTLVHTIVPERVYKGAPPTPVTASFPTMNATSPFKEGELYTFYLAGNERGDWQIIDCAPNHTGQPTAEEVALFGEGRAPAPPDTSKLWIPVVAMSVAVGGVGIVLLRNRFVRKAGR